MKSIKDIENMSLEQLEAVSMDESITVPDGFASRMKDGVQTCEVLEHLASDESEDRRKVRTLKIVSVAASVALLAGVGYGTASWQNQPKDTFDDPYLAYAEIEKAFEKMSTGINKSLAMAGETEVVIEKVASVFSEK